MALIARRILPGYGLTLGITLAFLSSIVLVPLAALFLKAAGLGPSDWARILTSPRTLAAFRLTFGASAAAAGVSTVFGLLIAWVLVRYRFPGRRILDAMVDLPFALPTAVAGITLAQLYGPRGWMGQVLQALGIQGAYSPFGVFIALTFISFPFVVRTVQPVLEDLQPDAEEAAATLGANRLVTFRRILLPTLFPALLTGFTLAFARAIGEYGSVVFISGNLPFKTEILPLLIIGQLEQFHYSAAAVIAASMLLVSFTLLFLINLLQRRLVARSH
ncbi:sulfate transport system permease protein [Haloferula luteola]|uniref:Sulfate transport system permease protein CysT n=1 Tax=Haloferula luteola TaxID=595692 RepID=A0A840V8P0_9BACT|nr:sulfate ABC transporter permease subunit CysT [Haloferula luteola]MBB5350149.1 sulfate transport system permease protein [Haloferula luteola]